MANDHDEAPSFSDRVTGWERATDEAANRLMGTEGFSQWINGMQGNQLAMQKAYAEFATQQMHAMNMPTRDDFVRLAEAVSRADRRLERIERLMLRSILDDRAQRRTDPDRPPRTRRPPEEGPETTDG